MSFDELREWLVFTPDAPPTHQDFLPPGWQDDIARWWDRADLRATERRLKRMAASARAGGEDPLGNVSYGVWSAAALHVRALFEQGRNESCLRRLGLFLAMGMPWWLMQVRFLAEGRLALLIGDEDAAYERFLLAVVVDLNGLADAGYLMVAFDELAKLTLRPTGAPSPKDWARLGLDVAAGLRACGFGAVLDGEIEERLRAIVD